MRSVVIENMKKLQAENNKIKNALNKTRTFSEKQIVLNNDKIVNLKNELKNAKREDIQKDELHASVLREKENLHMTAIQEKEKEHSVILQQAKENHESILKEKDNHYSLKFNLAVEQHQTQISSAMKEREEMAIAHEEDKDNLSAFHKLRSVIQKVIQRKRLKQQGFENSKIIARTMRSVVIEKIKKYKTKVQEINEKHLDLLNSTIKEKDDEKMNMLNEKNEIIKKFKKTVNITKAALTESQQNNTTLQKEFDENQAMFTIENMVRMKKNKKLMQTIIHKANTVKREAEMKRETAINQLNDEKTKDIEKITLLEQAHLINVKQIQMNNERFINKLKRDQIGTVEALENRHTTSIREMMDRHEKHVNELTHNTSLLMRQKDNEIDRQTLKLKEEKNNHLNALNKVLLNHDNTIKELNNKHELLVANEKEKYARMNENNILEITEMKEVNSKDIHQLQQKHASLTRLHEDRYNKLVIETSTKWKERETMYTNESTTRRKEFNETMESMTKQHEITIKDLKNAHMLLIKQLNTNLEAKMSNYKEQLGKEMSTKKLEFHSEIQLITNKLNMKSNEKNKLDAVYSKILLEMETMIQVHAKALEDADKDKENQKIALMNEMTNQLNDAEKGYRLQMDIMNNQLIEANKQLVVATTEIQGLEKDLLKMKRHNYANTIQRFVKNCLNKRKIQTLEKDWIKKVDSNQRKNEDEIKKMEKENKLNISKMCRDQEENIIRRLSLAQESHDEQISILNKSFEADQVKLNEMHEAALLTLQNEILDRHVQEMYTLSTEHRSKMNELEDTIEDLQNKVVKEHGRVKELEIIAQEQLALASDETTFERAGRYRSESETAVLLCKITKLEDILNETRNQLTKIKDDRLIKMDEIEKLKNEMSDVLGKMSILKEKNDEKLNQSLQKYNRPQYN